MAVTDMTIDEALAADDRTDRPPSPPGRRRDLQRTLQLWLAAVWLLDAILQIQPFMFTPGDDGLSGMIGGTAVGNPGWIAHTIMWNASIVDHHPVLTNTLFALVQFLIAFGIIWRRTCKAALGLSIVWSVLVWWFGEGLGGLFSGAATPFGGGPGGVLFYAVLAVVLWPKEGDDAPFVAARTLGPWAAKILWVAVWAVLGVLCLVGSGRSPQALLGVVTNTSSGEPGWLVHLDRYSGPLLLHDGTALAVVLAALCCVAASSVYLPVLSRRAVIVVVVVAFSLIWVTVQNLGGILASGATDPNSAPLVVLLALAYWPLSASRRVAAASASARDPAASCSASVSTVRGGAGTRPFRGREV